MDINMKKSRSAAIFEISGRFDVKSSEMVQEAIIQAISENGRFIVDFANCDYVSSSGLRVLLMTMRRSAMANCRMVVSGIKPEVWEIIVMTGFDKALETYPSQDEALKALSEGLS